MELNMNVREFVKFMFTSQYLWKFHSLFSY